MNSYELQKALDFIFRAYCERSYEVKIVTEAELLTHQITKPKTFLVVFVQGHPQDKKTGHFLLFVVNKLGLQIDPYEFYDTYNKPVEFYFKNLPFETVCLPHLVHQNDDSSDCALYILFFILQRQHAPHSRVLEHFDSLKQRNYLHTKCSDYYLNISYNITDSPLDYGTITYYPRQKQIVLQYFDKKNNGQ